MTNKFFGLYRGIVTDDKDPAGMRRIRAKVPAVFGETETRWALPCTPPGVLSVPEIGDGVWVEFEAGDPDVPVWIGVR